MISDKALEAIVHTNVVYDFGGMMGLIEQKFDKIQENEETKIEIPDAKYFNFWHFSLDYVIGHEIDNNCIRHVNWQDVVNDNKKKDQWIQDICKIGFDLFGAKNYEVYIGW